MASLSQALRLGDLPPPHRTFQGHAAHIIEWSMMLRPNGSWGTCIPQGIATFLHYASRRSTANQWTAWRTIVQDRCRWLCYGCQPSRLPSAFLECCFDDATTT